MDRFYEVEPVKPTAIRFDPIAARRIIRTCHRLDEDEPLDLKSDSQAAAIYRTWLVKGA